MKSGYKRGVKRFAISALVLLAACSSSPRIEHSPKDAEATFVLMVVAEDSRTLPPGLFEEASASSDAAIRWRAAASIGRIMKPAGIPILLTLASDAHPEVRSAAIFAMGQLGLAPEALSAKEVDALMKTVMAAMKVAEVSMRATAVEAMGKLAGDRAPALAAPLLKDPSPLVRRQAASACFRWRQVLRWRDPEAKPPPLPPVAMDALSGLVDDPDGEVRWRAIHALHRSGSSPSPATIGRFLRDREPLARMFALNLVERLKLKDLADAVARAQGDSDAGVRQAALRALNALERPELLLKTLVKDPSHHVREAVADLLAEAGPELETLSKDLSTSVRVAAFLARIRIAGEAWVDHMEEPVGDSDPRIRIAAVKAAGYHKEKGLPILWLLKSDAVEEVRAAVMVVLGPIEDPKAWSALREGLAAKGVAERGSAAEALKERKEPEAVEAAIECFKNSTGREWVEVRETIVDLLSAKPPEATTPFLSEVARTDASPSVRQKAVAALRKRGVTDLPAVPAEPATKTPHFTRRFESNPVVVMETTKGTLHIECLAREAPVHVANFVGLVEQGFYDGLTWHRVVPNFVIQGGDPLGFGWGDAGWSLRAEINPVLHKRGTLAMPRSAGFDTGGCQLYITHVPTPHLDGYYTVFGQVTDGLDVIDKIEVGDRIVKAAVKR